MLSENDIKEELSYAYLHAIASISSFACERTKVDRDSVDATVRAKGKITTESSLLSPAIDFQLKATSVERITDGEGFYHFELPVKNYEELRGETMLPRLLAVLILPENNMDWLSHTEDGLVSRRCVYWLALRGAPLSRNASSVTVKIPKRNVLSPESLKGLMIKTSKEELILYDG